MSLDAAVPKGTILDPATTRFVAKGATDPVSGLVNSSGGERYVRDPFGTCAPNTTTFTAGACGLNMLPAGRIDPNAAKVLDLYSGTELRRANVSAQALEYSSTATSSTYAAISIRTIKTRYLPATASPTIRSLFPASSEASRTADRSTKACKPPVLIRWLRAIPRYSRPIVNQVRAGFAHLHTTRFGPEGTRTAFPAQYRHSGHSPRAGKRRTPRLRYRRPRPAGKQAFLPSDEVSQTLQVSDDFTRIYGKHSFKMGIEYQNVKFSTLQPAWSHGQFNYGGGFTDIPKLRTPQVASLRFVLPPAAAPATIAGNPNPNGFSYSGGSDGVYASNISDHA